MRTLSQPAFSSLVLIPLLGLAVSACAGAVPGTVIPGGEEPSPPASSPTPPATDTPAPTPTTAFTPTPTGCAESRGRIERTEFRTDLLPEPLEIRVYLPPCYDPEAEVPYPVLIIIHGQTYNDDQWDRLGMDEKADELISSGQSRPFLIFMPLERHTERDPEQSNFDEVVAQALLPWVDENYNTCQERACRAVGGLSRGATWAVHIGFLRPGLFGSIGAHSLTPFFGDVYRLPYWLMHVSVDELPRFYLDMGEEDWFMDALAQYREALTENNVPYEWHLSSGMHDEAYWASHVEDYLRWYAEGWPSLP